ncbi:MAG: DNA polymerase III subunit delta [Candidatus Omnitrophica bacterium]|nr:DNA polymerase III subunit delta [Candidatus Omnitrophota bacterium]MDD5671969.1 DNA polymerase III subunit delta [Candidatus Omnitrophota bacterium]
MKEGGVVLIVGDSFLVKDKTDTLVKAIQQKATGDVAQQVFDLAETSLETILAQARTLPFLVSAQVFHLRSVQKLKAHDLESLERYLENPCEQTCLFFEADEADRDAGIVKLIEKTGKVFFLSEKEKKSAVTQFIKEKLKRAGKTITPEAVNLLEQDTGDMPSFLDTMLERLIAYAGKNNEITDDLVRRLEENWAHGDVFQMTNAIAERKLDLALKYLKDLMENQEKEVVDLLGILHWQIRKLWLAAVLYEEGEPQGEILRKLRISPKQAPYFTRQIKQFSRKQLEQALEGLFQLDWKMKSGRADGPIALEAWLVSLVG